MAGYKNNFAFSMLRRVYWGNPWIARNLTSFRRGLDIFSLDFDVQVDGFPRSANSFAVCYVECSQEGRIRVRRHHHLPSSVAHGVRNGKPVMLLLRHPRDCTVSHAIYMSSGVAEQVRFYRDYYQALRPYCRDVHIALFDDVVANMPGVLREFDRKFKLDWLHDYNAETVKRLAEAGVRQLGWSSDKDGHEDIRHISLPSKERDELKKGLQAELERAERGSMFAKALAEFEFFASHSARPRPKAPGAPQPTNRKGDAYVIQSAC